MGAPLQNQAQQSMGMQPLGFYGIYTPPSDCSRNLVLQL